MVVKDFYRILGIEAVAEPDEIKKAYRRLVKRYHPDARPVRDHSFAYERFKEVQEAYEILINPERRKKYDQMNNFGIGARGGYKPADRGREETPCEEVAAETAPSGGREAGKDKQAGTRTKTREKATDRVVELAISFETAINGGIQPLTVPVEEECEKCGGTGARTKRDLITCPNCEGLGSIHGPAPAEKTEGRCPRCGGRGTLSRHRCIRCQGTGRSRRDRKVSVQVPAGVEDGFRQDLAELVDPADRAGCKDITVEFKISPHPFYRREGLDIACEVPIGLSEAILGGMVAVKTAGGKRVVVQVPAGTDSGTTFRIKGEGVKKDGHTGHQLVSIKIVTPKQLSEKARQHLTLFLQEVDSRRK